MNPSLYLVGCHVLVGFVVGSQLCFQNLFPICPLFLLPRNAKPINSNLICLSPIRKPCRNFANLENYFLSHQQIVLINQSINQFINQSINLSIHQSINQSINQFKSFSCSDQISQKTALLLGSHS